MKIRIEEINSITYEILSRVGVPDEHISIINKTITFAHKRGKATHGIRHVPIFVKKIRNGFMTADTPISVINDHKAVLHIDAHNGFGQVATYYAMNEAIKRAEIYGISFVEVKDSNSFGTAGYFAKMAADNGKIGIVLGNSGPAIAAGRSGKAVFGTNPISVAMPTADPSNPLVFDMATSTVARSKVRLAEKKGEQIPLGWALDSSGNPTTDPSSALKGSMVPIGGYKGTGISMIIDLIAGMLSGSAFGGNVKPLNNDTGSSRYGNCVMAIDIAAFMDQETYNENMNYFCHVVHENEGIIPGEMSHQCELMNAESVDITENTVNEINNLAAELDIAQRL